MSRPDLWRRWVTPPDLSGRSVNRWRGACTTPPDLLGGARMTPPRLLKTLGSSLGPLRMLGNTHGPLTGSHGHLNNSPGPLGCSRSADLSSPVLLLAALDWYSRFGCGQGAGAARYYTNRRLKLVLEIENSLWMVAGGDGEGSFALPFSLHQEEGRIFGSGP